MFDYNKFSNRIKGLCINFGAKVSDSLNLPVIKAVNDIIFGIIKSNSSLLTEIARALNETIKVKDTVDRISKNLDKIYDNKDILYNNYYKNISNIITEATCFHVDNTDVDKDSSSKLEDLDRVKDGSDEDGKIVNGYTVTEIVATNTPNDLPISIYSKIFSTQSKEFKSLNSETLKAIDQVISFFGKIGTYVMDRGYDDLKYFKAFMKREVNFIIRGKTNRSVYHNGKNINILELAKKFKGKFNITLFLKGNVLHRYCSYTRIKVGDMDKEIYVVFVYFKNSTSIFYTNTELTTKHDVMKVISSYYMRWRIEEYFKFKKEQFDFENYRVRTLNKMNALNLMLSFAITCIANISNSSSEFKKAIIVIAKPIKETVYFEYYRIADGIEEILSHNCIGVRHLIKKIKPPKFTQLSLFWAA